MAGGNEAAGQQQPSSAVARSATHTSSMRTQRRSSIDFNTASIVRVILAEREQVGLAGDASAIAQISSRASMIFWSMFFGALPGIRWNAA